MSSQAVPTTTVPVQRPKAYSYIRFSSPEQMKGSSYQRQDEGTRKYALEHGLELDESLVLEDLGISAFRGKHAKAGALGRFLDAVQDGRVSPGSYLIIENLDRLSREDALTALEQLQSLMNQGIAVVTLHDGTLYTRALLSKNLGTLMMALGAMYRAHEESDTKSKRLSKSWEYKRQDARTKGKPMTSTCPQWLKLDKATGKYIPTPDKVKVVQHIFNETLGGKGANSITRQLNAEGVPPFGRSKGWGDSYVKKILANESVFGRLHPHTTKEVPGRRVPVGLPIDDFYPTIITKETFFKAKAMREQRRIPGGRSVQWLSNLFTKMVRCGVCGATMVYDNKGRGPKGGTYLVCSAAKRKLGTCSRHAWPYPPTEAHLLYGMSRLDFRSLFPKMFAHAQEQTRQLTSELATKEAELIDTEAKVSRIVGALAEAQASPALLSKLKELEALASDLKEGLKTTTKALVSVKEQAMSVEDRLEQMMSAFSEYLGVAILDDPDKLKPLRLKLHLLLRSQVTSIKMFPATDSQYYGTIDITLQGAGGVVRVKMLKGLRDSSVYDVQEDGTEEWRGTVVNDFLAALSR